MNGKIALSILLAVMLMGIVTFNAIGVDETTVPLTIEPGETGGSPLPHLEGDTIDVKMTSDIPVNVYILSYEVFMNNLTYGEELVYEKMWESETSLDVDYTVEDPDQPYYIMVENPSDSETANVELEYKLYQELAEEAAKDAAEDACFGTMFAGIAALTILAALAVYIKKRSV